MNPDRPGEKGTRGEVEMGQIKEEANLSDGEHHCSATSKSQVRRAGDTPPSIQRDC